MKHHAVLFFWTSDQLVVRLRERRGEAVKPFEGLFRPGEWRRVQGVGHLRQLTDLGAIEYAHGVIGHSVDLFDGLPVEYIPDRWPYPPERCDRLHAEFRAEWVAQGRGDEVDRATFSSHEEFWRELKKLLSSST